MNQNDSLSERRKREKEFEEFTRRNRAWTDKYLNEMAEFFLDVWLWKKKRKKGEDNPADTGSIPTES
jgi:hypothetical protein